MRLVLGIPKPIDLTRKVLPTVLAVGCLLTAARTSFALGCAHEATKSADGRSHFTLLSRLGAVAKEKDASRSPSQPPCSGPSCSDRRGNPWVPETSSAPFGGRDWAQLADLFVFNPADSRAIVPTWTATSPQPSLSSIFHPPRFGFFFLSV